MPQPARLTYYPDSRPGISRRRCGRGWSYAAPDGTTIDDRGERRRLNALAVPPAYRQVWICPRADGHLQATGRDNRARKQYRYHPDWPAFRSRRKFDHLADFGAALPRIRARITRDLSGEAGDHGYAIAAVLALIDRLSLRVGNRDYAEENGTYGATTLRARHMRLDDEGLRLAYPAKGGRKVSKLLHDRRLQRVLGQLDDLPGAALVTWLDEGGTPHEVQSHEVNALLAELTGDEAITAKTFRTWNGSVAALERALLDPEATIKALAGAAAEQLHNTPTVARDSYVHPRVIDLLDQPPEARTRLAARAPQHRGLRRAEATLLALLD